MKNNRIGLWIAGAVMLVAVLIGVVGLVWPRDGDTASTPSDAATASTATVGEGPCPDTLFPSTTSAVPADLRWVASQGVAWPVSDTVGPTATTDGFPTCFQQSPIGAALFSTGFLGTSVDHPVQGLISRYFAPSATKDQLLSAAASTSGSAPSFAQQLKSIGANYVGYRIDGYNNETADVTAVMSIPNTATGFRGVKLSLVWIDGDWHIQNIPAEGGDNIFFDVLDGQFTKWSA